MMGRHLSTYGPSLHGLQGIVHPFRGFIATIPEIIMGLVSHGVVGVDP